MSKLENFVKSLFDFKRVPKEHRGTISTPTCQPAVADAVGKAQAFAKYKTEEIQKNLSRAAMCTGQLRSLLSAPVIEDANKDSHIIMTTSMYYMDFPSGEEKKIQVEIVFSLRGDPLCAEIVGDDDE